MPRWSRSFFNRVRPMRINSEKKKKKIKKKVYITKMNAYYFIKGKQTLNKKKRKEKKEKKSEKSTTPGIPRRSPIQVLTGPDVA